LGVAVWALIRYWPNFWPAIAIGVVLLAYMAVLAWAARCRYIHFVPRPDGSLASTATPASTPLAKEELVPVRASGLFSVEGQEQYYVDLEASFETVGTREHIVLAQVHPSRFMLVGRWPSHEHGWWYIFFEPAMIRQLDEGHMYFGAQPQPALRLVYAPDDKSEATIYLAFGTAPQMQRVWDDLLADAPPGIIVPGPSGQLRDQQPAT
jgi:hypothetical protein